MFLEIKQIKKAFGQGESRVEVLRGIDLSLERGEFCVLLGLWRGENSVSSWGPQDPANRPFSI